MHQGIAMIELVFTIMVMGIVLMSAPMLISTATKSGYVAIQQESIGEAASQINMILSYHWDENNTNESYHDPVLQADGDVNLSEYASTGKRIGTPEASHRKFVTSDGQRLHASLSLGADGTEEKDDMDDFNGITSLTKIQDSTTSDYTETITIDINRTVAYLADDSPAANTGSYEDPGDTTLSFSPDFSAASTGTTNIKRIQVTLTSSSGQAELDKEITLHAFSCNIGSYELEER